MDWITPQIAIGHVHDAVHLDPAVDAVVCLKEGCRYGQAGHGRPVYAVPLVDGPGNRAEDVGEALDQIAYVVDECGEKVLVHCNAGRSRSPTLVAAYLVAHRGMTPKEAFGLIASRRNISVTNGITDILRFVGS